MEQKVRVILNTCQFEEELIKEILETGRQKKVKEGELVFHSEERIEEIPFVIEGLLKISKTRDDGQEMFLYFLNEGESCAMSISCCIESRKNEFILAAEENSVLWMVPLIRLDHWLQKYLSFRKFVFASYQDKFTDMMDTIDALSFMKMEERLEKYLRDKKQATGSFVIEMTHEQIARELNTSRVVVSRLLKELERKEVIEQSRNKIELL